MNGRGLRHRANVLGWQEKEQCWEAVERCETADVPREAPGRSIEVQSLFGQLKCDAKNIACVGRILRTAEEELLVDIAKWLLRCIGVAA